MENTNLTTQTNNGMTPQQIGSIAGLIIAVGGVIYKLTDLLTQRGYRFKLTYKDASLEASPSSESSKNSA